MAVSRFSILAVAALSLLFSLCSAAPSQPISLFKRRGGLKFDFNNEKVRGVNLGGWFVLEPWITPSLFEQVPDNVIDEYTMSAFYGKTEMESRMEQHWSTWITEADFSQIAGLGLNFVRIPIGYWAMAPIQGEPYVQGSYDWLAKALDWAEGAGLKVIIDLHGAPGSQNGLDNSGRRGPIDWTQGDTVAQTHKALNKIRDDHASHPAVAAIELVNEPEGPVVGLNAVTQFYYDGAGDLQGYPVAITLHDAFEGVNSWNQFGNGLSNLMIDTHYYQIFDSGGLQMSVSDHISTACQFGPQMAANNKWTIAGEFTGAMTDCAKWVNGKNVGSKYDGTFQGSFYIGSCDGLSTGTVDGLSQDEKNNLSAFIQAQMTTYELAAGWVFWTWVTESAPEWNYKDLAAAGVIPNAGSIDASACG